MKGQYTRTSAVRAKNRSSLLGNTPWNKGNVKLPPIRTDEELAVLADVRAQKLKARALKTAGTKRRVTIEKYLSLADNINWANTKFSTDERGVDYLELTHVPCGTSLKVQTQTIRKHIASSSLCKTCNPVFRGVSKAETELFLFVQELVTVQRHFKLPSGLELDMLMPDIKLAIEYNGLYWHSDRAGYPANKHVQKTNEAEALGLRLIQIFEDEWIHKPELIKSRLRVLLGVQETTLYARKLQLKEISSSVSRVFLTENHLQGSAEAKVRYGLYNDDELVAVMTFSKPRFNKKYSWELIRFATKQDVRVIGGASRLLAAFKRSNYGSIISYADRRWSTGNLYKVLGFKLVGVSTPSYWYFKGDLRKSRQTYQKAKLKDFPEYSAEKTEAEIMFLAGWNRIWDCGNLVFELIDGIDPT